jgi:transglutaminase-like putative cysteine protease
MRIQLLNAWIQTHIERKAVDVFTALDVLEGRAAECQGHALLYAALARSIDLPTRVVNGIVYVKDFRGFLYHTWNETHVEGRWIAVDPTFGQVPADVTHVKFLEGSEIADLLPLVAVIGKIRVQILSAE